jgi:hypothetical protein
MISEIQFEGRTLPLIAGDGINRWVFQYDEDSILKVKKDEHDSELVNFNEWKNWLLVKGTELEKYFCPCVKYYETGELLMKLAKPLRFGPWQEYLEIPVFISDYLSEGNFGVYGGRIVHLDYPILINLPEGFAPIQPAESEI